MKRINLFLFLVLCTINSLAQIKTRDINAGGFKIQMSTADTTISNAFFLVGQMPEFPGGVTKLVEFAKKNIPYPNSAINDNIQGSVVLQYTIDKKGKTINKKIIKGVREDLDTLCLNMLNKMPRWKSGRLNGKPVAINFNWTITFILSD
jgi:TonB family protein